MKNLGFIYNKDIFNNLKISLKGKKEGNTNKTKHYFYEPLIKEVKEKQGNRKIKKTIITDFGKYNNEFLSQKINEKYDVGVKYSHLFKLQTIYPGLLSGSGYTHEIGGMEEEFQLGFFFDHTTGRPIIPGSSIKGVLRYACEVNKGDYLKQKLTDLKIETSSYFEAIITKNKKGENVINPSEFVSNVFEGKLLKKDEQGQVKCDEQGKPIVEQNMSIYQRDIFLDAFPILSNGALLGADYITPHGDNPLQNPIPIKFLRVQPEVTYQFQFDLENSNGITAEQKKQLFQQIILDLGLGAKTNVGYGQFKIDENDDDLWSKIETLKIGSLVKGKVVDYESGNAKVKLHIKKLDIILNVQGKKNFLEKNSIVMLKIKETSGSIKNGNYIVTRVSLQHKNES